MPSIILPASLVILTALSARAAPASDVSSDRLWNIFAGHPAGPPDFKFTQADPPPTTSPPVFVTLAASSPTSVLTTDNNPDAQMAAAITGSAVLIAFICIAGYLYKEWRLRQKSNLNEYTGGPWSNSKEACGTVNELYVDESPPANPPMTNQTSPPLSLKRATLLASTDTSPSQVPVSAPFGFQPPKIQVPKQSVVPLSGVIPSAEPTVDQTGSQESYKAGETRSP